MQSFAIKGELFVDKTAYKAFIGCFFLMAVMLVMSPKQSITPEITPEDSKEFTESKAASSVVAETLVQKPASRKEILDLPVQVMNVPEMIQHLQSSLPQNGKLKIDKEADFHHMHPAILRAGMELGHLKEMWIHQPMERPLAFNFYEQCTFDQSLIESVRALCYVSAIEVSVYLKKTDKVLAWNVDSSIQDLASKLLSN
jgi:hypothetical protein